MKRRFVSAFFCGEGYDKHSWKDQFVCSECGAIFEIPPMIKGPQITLDEAMINFANIPLTKKKGRNIRYKAKDAPKQEVGAL